MLNEALKPQEFDFDIIDVKQGTEEWLRFRDCGIGASDLPIIMNLFKEKGAYELWLLKTARINRENTNYLAERGRRLEPIARKIAEDHFKTTFDTPTIARKDTPWAIASLDGANADFSILLEIKCPHLTTYKKIIETGELSEAYRYQCQWQMYVSSMQSVQCMIFSGAEYTIIEEKRNPLIIEKLYQAACEFREFILNDIEPPHDIETLQYRNDDEFVSRSKEVVRLKKICDDYGKQYKEERTALLDCTDGGNCEGDLVSITWSKPDWAVDYKGIVEYLKVGEEVIKKFSKPKESFPTVKIKK